MNACPLPALTKQHNTRVMRPSMALLLVGCAMIAALGSGVSAYAQPVSAVATTKAPAATLGISMSELLPSAPTHYTVKAGDTLWSIAGLFLKKPWLWLDLWGIDASEPQHAPVIYSGEVITLEKSDGRARLVSGAGADTPAIKIRPRSVNDSLSDTAIAALAQSMLEPFISEPLVVDEAAHRLAPRVVSAQSERELFSKGDRIYALSSRPEDLQMQGITPRRFRVYRNATPLRDPDTQQILGYEAHFLGSADLITGMRERDPATRDNKSPREIVAASLHIVSSQEEIRIGDRLLPASTNTAGTLVPRPPKRAVEGVRVMATYGDNVVSTAQYATVSLNRGAAHGIEPGHVLELLRDGQQRLDRTAEKSQHIWLPDESNGIAIVFRVFDKVSYALIVQAADAVKAGDRLVNPR